MSYQEQLLSWYRANKRNLPWRKTTNPWHIIISEFMLQQTQVSRVIPKYEHWIQKYPTPQDCAQASTKNILHDWQGLGYNSRGLRLKKLAENYPQPFPQTAQELQKLPGIGPYTANAILAFAFNKDVSVKDVNIERVLSRITGTYVTEQEILKELPKGQSRNWYNALMDFGSSICTATTPQCTLCPVQDYCKQPGMLIAKPKQKPFKGSWRMHRGKLLKLLLAKQELSTTQLQTLLLLDAETTQKLITELEEEGFLERDKQRIRIIQ